MCAPDVLSARAVAMAVAPALAMAPGTSVPSCAHSPRHAHSCRMIHRLPWISFPHPKPVQPYAEIPASLEREGKSSPFPKGFQLNCSSFIKPVVFTANIAQHFGSLASLECKTSPTETFFSCKANTFSVTRTIFLRHEQRVRFLQTKEP